MCLKTSHFITVKFKNADYILTRPLRHTINLNSFLDGVDAPATGLKKRGRKIPMAGLHHLIWKPTERKTLPLRSGLKTLVC